MASTVSVPPLRLVALIRPTVPAWPRLPGVHWIDGFPAGPRGPAGSEDVPQPLTRKAVTDMVATDMVATDMAATGRRLWLIDGG